MAKDFEFKVYNDNMLLINSFDVKEDECNRLIDKIQRTYFTPSGPFDVPYEEVAVNKSNGEKGYFNLTPWTIVKYHEKGINVKAVLPTSDYNHTNVEPNISVSIIPALPIVTAENKNVVADLKPKNLLELAAPAIVKDKLVTENRPLYVHAAWAYNSDGTDRFTTVYPNLNLLDGTSSSLKKISATGWGYNYADSKRVKLNLKKGHTTTYSVWIQDCDIDTRGVIYLYDSQNKQYNKFGNIIKAGTSGFSTVTVTIDVDITRFIAGIGFLSKQSDSHSFSYSKLKLEPGSVATPHMPSASEVTPADYPKYIGHYTDFTQADSTKPSDYTWSPI